MSTDTERRVPVRPDATVAYWVSGPDGAPVVVLLHGATLDHHAWDDQVEALATRYRVVVPDLRGHGESTLQDRFDFDAAVDDLVALLDEVDDGAPLALGGLSLGGNIAQEIVYRQPGRVDALVVADSTCNTAPRHSLAAPLTIAALSAMALGGRERFMRHAAAVTSARQDVRRYVLDVTENRTAGEVLQILVSLLDGALHPDPDYRLPVPTLLLVGAEDRIGDIIAGSREWAARDPLVEHVVVPGAGHASNQDNPAAFNTALLAFLDSVLPVTAGGTGSERSRAACTTGVPRPRRGGLGERPGRASAPPDDDVLSDDGRTFTSRSSKWPHPLHEPRRSERARRE
jgi:3-oxoadipate enol-lactonase